MKKWKLESRDGYALIFNEGGITLGRSAASGLSILEDDGFAFKDLNGNGILDPYEDWRLPMEDRVRDLAARLSVEDIAGLMLYSAHQSVSVPRSDDPFALRFAGTYGGKPFLESGADISELSDQQKDFLEKDRLRHVLMTSVENPETAARWNNNLQAFCESKGFGIPVNISSDPRHGAESNGEYQVGAGGQISQWPSTLGLAATFDPALVRRFGEIASEEFRALGIATALSPQIDLATDPRWSRFSGTFGESARMSSDMARAYCDGFQTSEGESALADGWGYQSVNAMVKHWPGGGAGEGGRDAHFAFGKFAVYPGNNFDEALIPFTEGAFKLDGPTKAASAVMPYYTISCGRDIKYGENVGNSYSRYIIGDLLREQYGFEGVVCTDWGITKDNPAPDSFGTTSWGVYHLNENERHYKAILAGIDQFGGNNKAGPILAAYSMGCAARGEAFMRARMEASAVRLLRNMFRTGLFDNPYCDVARTKATAGKPAFMEAGYEAQKKSIVLLKNENRVLPMKRCKVYIPRRYRAAGKNMFGMETPEKCFPAVDSNIAAKYYDIAETPEEADFAVVFMDSPASAGYDRERGGYLPITLQYRSYTAATARAHSIGYGDPYDENPNRSYKGRTNTASNEADLDSLLQTRKAMGTKPVIVVLNLKNPTVMKELEPFADALLVSFECQAQAVFDILTGAAEPTGLLPCQLPADMETVEAQYEDVPRDMVCHTDGCGNTYDFAFGLNWSGVIQDERVNKYK